MTAEAPGERLSVLVIDDEKNIRATLSMSLEAMGCSVATAATPESALAQLSRTPFDLAFLDLKLGETDGLELLPRLLAEAPALDVVVITAYAAFETAVEATKRGARDYLPKPFTPAQIRHVVEQVAEKRRLRIPTTRCGAHPLRARRWRRQVRAFACLWPDQGCNTRAEGWRCRNSLHPLGLAIRNPAHPTATCTAPRCDLHGYDRRKPLPAGRRRCIFVGTSGETRGSGPGNLGGHPKVPS